MLTDKVQNVSWQMIIFLILPFNFHYCTLCPSYSLFSLLCLWFSLLTSLILPCIVKSPTLCNPMNGSTPGLPVHHQLPEFTQTHVHRVSDAVQPSHPLSSPSPPAPDDSQHQGLFQRVNSLHEVAKVLEFQLLHQPYQ